MTPAPNASRFRPEASTGFYESYFLRANHAARPLAFWIRYTVFRPEGPDAEACGELWAIWFDGENDRSAAVKEVVPIAQCTLSRHQLDVRLGSATLTPGAAQGRAASASHTLQWSLRYQGSDASPLFLLPQPMYERGFPKAKALVALPNPLFSGALTVDGREIAIDGWQGSQNHNWGTRHTDRYAWGQVAGFDNDPEAFLECATAQVRIGLLWTPRMTMVVLRHGGQEIALNGLLQATRASGRCEFFDWRFDSPGPEVRIRGRLHAPASAFVGLGYRNPPGGVKTCLNTKLATAEITVERPGQPTVVLKSAHRAAFEILTDRSDHGIRIAA